MRDISNYVMPLDMNGLSGRMLRIPNKTPGKRHILFLYGHHASLERIFGIAEDLQQYGTVSTPDLPGFGGMDSFYTIGMKPTLDNYADYLASFIKLTYRGKKVTIAALSFSFLIVTRMLQRYPELTKKVELLISIVGFSHKDDFAFSRNRYWFYRIGSAFFARKLPSKFFYNVLLHPTVIRLVYDKSYNAKNKFNTLPKKDRKATMDFEVYLWRTNDLRTHMATSHIMITVDNCQKQVDLPIWHVSVNADQYFNNAVVEQHLRIIFTDVIEDRAKVKAHAPSIIADKASAAPMIPKKIRAKLAEEPM